MVCSQRAHLGQVSSEGSARPHLYPPDRLHTPGRLHTTSCHTVCTPTLGYGCSNDMIDKKALSARSPVPGRCRKRPSFPPGSHSSGARPPAAVAPVRSSCPLVLFTRQALALPHRLLVAGYRLGPAPDSTPAIPPVLVFRPHLKRKEMRSMAWGLLPGSAWVSRTTDCGQSRTHHCGGGALSGRGLVAR